MSLIETGKKDFGSLEGGEATVWVDNAVSEAVDYVLNTDPTDHDGRSQWVWMRFPNGDLFLACAPQGETYFAAWEGIQERGEITI